MSHDYEANSGSATLEDNLKKAVTEMMVLHLFSVRDHYIGELSAQINNLSKKGLSIVFPYAAIYRLVRSGFVRELPRRIAPDGRLRQYYQITDEGRERLAELKQTYDAFSGWVGMVLAWEGDEQ